MLQSNLLADCYERGSSKCIYTPDFGFCLTVWYLKRDVYEIHSWYADTSTQIFSMWLVNHRQSMTIDQSQVQIKFFHISLITHTSLHWHYCNSGNLITLWKLWLFHQNVDSSICIHSFLHLQLYKSIKTALTFYFHGSKNKITDLKKKALFVLPFTKYYFINYQTVIWSGVSREKVQ